MTVGNDQARLEIFDLDTRLFSAVPDLVETREYILPPFLPHIPFYSGPEDVPSLIVTAIYQLKISCEVLANRRK